MQHDKNKQVVLYVIGEEIVYNNNDHIEKGVVENIAVDNNKS